MFLLYFLFCCSFTLQMEPSLTISTLYPCLNIVVTLQAVFTFYVSLLFVDAIIFCFIFITFWLFSSINLYTSITILWFFFFLCLSIPYQCFFFKLASWYSPSQVIMFFLHSPATNTPYFFCHYFFYPFFKMFHPDVSFIFFCWVFLVILYIFYGVCYIFLPFQYLGLIFNLVYRFCARFRDFYWLWLFCLFMS